MDGLCDGWIQLYTRFRTASDEEGEYGMCRIFVEMGEAYLPLIVERRAGDATPIIIQVTSALVWSAPTTALEPFCYLYCEDKTAALWLISADRFQTNAKCESVVATNAGVPGSDGQRKPEHRTYDVQLLVGAHCASPATLPTAWMSWPPHLARPSFFTALALRSL
jgi:hypothetical protein